VKCVVRLSHFHRRCRVEALCEVYIIIETSSSLLHYYIQIYLPTNTYSTSIHPNYTSHNYLHLVRPTCLLEGFPYNQACSTFSLYSTSSSPSLVVRIEWICISALSPCSTSICEIVAERMKVKEEETYLRRWIQSPFLCPLPSL
jgi:hypothetical protein